MANSIPPFDTSNSVTGAAVNFLPSSSTVTSSSPAGGATKTANTTKSPSRVKSTGKSGADVGTTILNAALGFFTGGLGGLVSGISGGISGSGGGGPAKPTFFDFISGIFGGKKK